MTTNFPVGLDSFNNPSPTDQLGSSFVPHHQQHTDANDAIEAMQRSIGVTDSADPTSIQYRLGVVETPGPFYGGFINDTDVAFVANTPKAIPFPVVLAASGITVGTPNSRLVVQNSGLYSVSINIQLLSGVTQLVQSYIWLRKNGVDIPNSSNQLSLTDVNYAVVAAWQLYVNMAGNDYLEVVVATDNAAVTLDYDPGVATPYVRPAGPSALVIMRQVDQ